MADETRVDPAVLDGLAKTSHELGDELDRAEGRLEPATGSAVGALRGFDAGGALERTHASWDEAAKGFGTHLRKVGDALSACARDYRYSDHAAAANFAGLDR